MFTDVFLPESQLLTADPRSSIFLATSLICRGKVSITDLTRNITRLQKGMKFPNWNPHPWKTGLCGIAALGQPRSVLAVSNNASVTTVLKRVQDRFSLLYRRKAHLHHYLEHMDITDFGYAKESLSLIVKEYESL